MFNSFKYSWRLFSRGGWKGLTNVLILFCSFTFLGTFLVYESHNPYFQVVIVTYLLIYIDNSTLRFFAPIDLTNFLPFPESVLKKYARLIIIESSGTKLYLILIYLIVQCIFNSLYLYPLIFLFCVFAFVAYQFLFIPLLMMVKRKTAYAYVFRAFAPVIMILPIILMKKIDGTNKFSEEIISFINLHLGSFIAGAAVFTCLSFAIGIFFFRRIYIAYPFQNEEVVDKLKRLRR